MTAERLRLEAPLVVGCIVPRAARVFKKPRPIVVLVVALLLGLDELRGVASHRHLPIIIQ